jgi:hypothetical protein
MRESLHGHGLNNMVKKDEGDKVWIDFRHKIIDMINWKELNFHKFKQ